MYRCFFMFGIPGIAQLVCVRHPEDSIKYMSSNYAVREQTSMNVLGLQDR